MRIAVAQLLHETNSFSNIPTTEDNFREFPFGLGDEIFTMYADINGYITGMIDEGKRNKVDIVPILSTEACPSGLITRECFNSLKGYIIDGLRKAGNLDGICLALHGAAMSEATNDVEGAILREIREIVGTEIPIFITLDLHANISPDMVKYATAIFPVKFYPHTDLYDTGVRAMNYLIKTIRGEIEPKMEVLFLRLLEPSRNATADSPMKEITEYCASLMKHIDVIDCSFVHGFTPADSPYTGSSVIAICNRSLELAQKTAKDAAYYIWSKREEFFPTYYSVEEALDKALELDVRQIIINDTSDNPGGGSPGDSTFLLRELLRRNVKDTCFAYIHDKESTEKAHAAGVGQYIDLKLGGKTDNRHGEPVEVKDAYVKVLSDGKFKIQGPMMTGTSVNLGKSARLIIGNVNVIISSGRMQMLDGQLMKLHGIDIEDCRILCLKSTQHFRAFFEPKCAAIITAVSPGIMSPRPEDYEFKYIRRPIYPLDKNIVNPFYEYP